MNSPENELGKDFHRARQDDNEKAIGELASSFPDKKPATSREAQLDSADVAYSKLHSAGKLDEPFEWPSARASRLQREAMAENRPPEIRSFYWSDRKYASSQEEIRMARDPVQVLAYEPKGTVAIHEIINDNDALDGSSQVTWLRCKDIDEARRYISQVGTSFSEPGPGEEDGKYTFRTIYIKNGPTEVQEVSPFGGY